LTQVCHHEWVPVASYRIVKIRFRSSQRRQTVAAPEIIVTIEWRVFETRCSC